MAFLCSNGHSDRTELLDKWQNYRPNFNWSYINLLKINFNGIWANRTTSSL